MDIASVSGTIFNIQKFSLHDGPGIRTVVFFKGCPLHCKWCANPESQRMRPQLLWDHETCLRCHQCETHCQKQAIQWQEDRLSILTTSCDLCEHCIEECPAHALSLEGTVQSVEEVLTICLQDQEFYEESGGGVTLSGGEVLLQPEFAKALLQKLKQQGIHTAIETTGYAAISTFATLLPYVDLLLFDIKHWQEEAHLQGTGVSNRTILEAMRYAVETKKEVLPRLPVIPGYNDSLADAEGIANCLKSIGLQRVQLLPFHQFGEKKYELLQQTYAYADIAALHEEDLQEYAQRLKSCGIDAFF